MKLLKYIAVFFLLTLPNFSVEYVTNQTFNTPSSGTTIDVRAEEFVKLMSNFQYKAQTGNYFRAKINRKNYPLENLAVLSEAQNSFTFQCKQT